MNGPRASMPAPWPESTISQDTLRISPHRKDGHLPVSAFVSLDYITLETWLSMVNSDIILNEQVTRTISILTISACSVHNALDFLPCIRPLFFLFLVYVLNFKIMGTVTVRIHD